MVEPVVEIGTHYRVRFQGEKGKQSIVGKLMGASPLLYRFQVGQKFSEAEGLTDLQHVIDKTLVTEMYPVKAEWRDRGNTSVFVEVR